ncbi:thioredoxin domain-containing protein [Flavimobilis sp. GY10621]|uniref:Thioredoxin domain-containing protein n=1 Tax=Flavimobilis rhizosphaerae TaxID=2775421 RepID=A0ABR9DMJ2_9MICO|nr:thioredoxin domain-containing protein [Flavimobilis rhizosphaerae]MBD9698129.1 thioredoxin domain-containing protein [Flavimobilis rhizosphaerae]
MSSKKSAPAQSRDAARNLAATMRAEQAAREKRVKIITISAFGVAVAALVAAIIWAVIASRPAELPEPAPLATPSVAAESGGISLGKDGVAGTANEGAPVVDVYLDYMCPWCGVFEETNSALLTELREAGDITLVVHPVTILDRLSSGTAFSTRSAAAAVYVAEKAPEHFDAFNTAMFAKQPEENSKGLTDREIADIAKSVGVPADVVDGIANLDSYKQFARWVGSQTEKASADTKLHTQDGIFSTPTIVVGGTKFEGDWRNEQQFRAAIDAAKQG